MSSLRRDIHSAFEVITPPVGGMPERVVQTVLADKRRQRKERMVYRMRFPLALVAAALLVAVGVAAVVTWNSLHSGNVSPAGPPIHYSVAQLEARALHIPVPTSAANCHSGPFDTTGGGFGSAPVYASPGPSTTSAWGNYYHIFAYAHAPVEGPVLVRVIHLFNSDPVVFVGPNAAGAGLGTDTVDGQSFEQRTEAVIMDPTTSAKNPGSPWNIPTGSYHYFWPLMSGESIGATGATGWQIDGPGFSKTFLAC